jgi:hypothetical protein
MRLRHLALACLLLCVPQIAQASSCYIREYTVPGYTRGLVVQIAQEQGLDQTPVSISGSSAASAAFKNTTNIVRVVCGANASFNFGASPTATTSNSYLPAGLPEYFAVSAGQGWSVAFISNASP